MDIVPPLIRRLRGFRASALRFELRVAPSESQRLFALTVAVGVVCGLAAVAFHFVRRFPRWAGWVPGRRISTAQPAVTDAG